MALQSYRDLIVWQKGMDLVDVCYDLTENFPRSELFGLRSQIRDAVCSIPSNIAEGYGRRHRGDYYRHLSIANGSLAELETRLLVSLRRKFVTREGMATAWELMEEVGKMLRRLMDKIEAMIERDSVGTRNAQVRKARSRSIP